MSETVKYIQGADLPDLALTLTDSAGNVLALSSVAHSFALKVGTPGSAAVLTKTTGFTAADTAPNLTVAWATSGELNTLTPDAYTMDVIATRTSDSKNRPFRFTLIIAPAIT